MKLAEITADELRALIRETVEEVLRDHLGDPDLGLELRDDLKARLAASLESQEPSIPAKEVAERLGLSW